MNGVAQIVVGWQSAGRSGSALENRRGEIARLGIDPLGVFPQTVPVRTVAPDAIATILLLAGGRVSGEASDVTLLSRKRGCRRREQDDTQIRHKLLSQSSESHDDPPRLRKQNPARTTATCSRPAYLSTAVVVRLPPRSTAQSRW